MNMNKKFNKESKVLITRDKEKELGKYYFSQLDEAGKKRIMDSAITFTGMTIDKIVSVPPVVLVKDILEDYLGYIDLISYHEYKANRVSKERAEYLQSTLDKEELEGKDSSKS